MSLKDTVGRALESLRRNAAAGGAVSAFIDKFGHAIAFQGDTLAPYVDPIITVGDDIEYRADADLTTVYTAPLPDIDVEDWSTILFGFDYTSAAIAGRYSVLPEYKTTSGSYIPFGVLDGTIAAFQPSGFPLIYGTRTVYGAAFDSIPATAANERVAWSLPFDVSYYKTIRLRVAESSVVAVGTLQIFYALSR